MHVLTIGVVCFGLLVGYITYRTLIRSTAQAAINDLATVVGAVGGGAVTAIVDPKSDLFGWYAIGLLAGFIIYGVLYKFIGDQDFSVVMGIDRR
ncbi:MAG: hypothetical protein HOV87_22480 [Catenulispora sp.]|nr:hypothetical protein [Catenulispora sp.]